MVEWESVLREAAERVQEVRDRLAGSQEGAEKLGEGASGDITMRVDQEAEEAIIDAVSQKGDIRIVAEEHGESGSLGARWTVVIDPIDGSSNFEKGIPFYCTSIAVLEGDTLEKVSHGLVRNLISGETYYSEAAGYSTKNAERIRASEVMELREATVGIDVSKTTTPVVQSLSGLMVSIKRQVHLGSSALEVCFLGEGRIDGFVDVRSRIRVMDIAAGYLIAKQSGAVFSDGRGGPLNPKISVKERFNMVGGANHILHDKIVAKLV